MQFNFASLLYGFLALAALPALSQSPAVTPDPAEKDAGVPAVKYESAFEGYVSYREQALAPWREINDEVGRIGGHVGMFRGAGHAAHGASRPAPSKPAAGQPAGEPHETPGQPPKRGAPQAPQGGHQGH